MTKLELQQQLAKLANENSELRAYISELRLQVEISSDYLASQVATKAAAPSSHTYPLTDYRGRAYRQEGRVKCFAPV